MKSRKAPLLWGFNLQPSEGDPRLVETRVLIDGDGKPTSLEHHLITRKADQSARDEKVVTVPWPAEPQCHEQQGN